MEEQMSKRFIRVAAVLLLLLLVAVGAGQELKRGMAEEQGESGQTVNDDGAGRNAEARQVGGTYKYERVLGENTVRILAYLGDEKIVFVPERLDGMEVSVIGRSAFAGKSVMEQVLLPSSVTEIEQEAFAYCSRLNTSLWGIVSVRLGRKPLRIVRALKKSVFQRDLINLDTASAQIAPAGESLFPAGYGKVFT